MSKHEQSVFAVTPRTPVYHGVYYVVAKDFGEAEAKVLSVETADGFDCGGIERIERMSSYIDEEPRQFLNF